MTPQLRFPEFTDEWQVKKLGDFSSITTGKLDANAMVEGGRYRFYTCAREFYRIDHYAFDTEALLVSGNGANVGYIHYYNGKFNAYQRTYVLNNFEENIGYIKLYLDRYLKKRILQEKFEGNMPYIVLSTLKDMPISIPPLKEQKKIADFLTAVDERIRLGEQKLAKLEQYKRGVMQQIFSQKIRFKDENGNEYPEWEEKDLGELVEVKTGNLNVDDANPEGKYHFFDRSIDIKRYDEYSFDNEALIYSGEGSEFLPRYFKGKYGLHQRAYTIFNPKNLYMKFLYYFMLTQNKHFLKTAVGTTVKSLRMDCFTKCTVPLPNGEEQQKIATFLAALDDKITAEKSKLTVAKQFRKALLQRMFV